MNNECDLLDNVRFTQTVSSEELDTLTVAPDFVKDPEKFMQVC